MVPGALSRQSKLIQLVALPGTLGMLGVPCSATGPCLPAPPAWGAARHRPPSATPTLPRLGLFWRLLPPACR